MGDPQVSSVTKQGGSTALDEFYLLFCAKQQD